jgi:predicted transcriptional regulator
MANLTIQLPDDVARNLEGIAAAQRKTVQQLALEQLRALISEPHAGSPEAVLRAMREPPHTNAADVEELDAAILAGRLAVGDRAPFSTDPS